MCVIKKQIYEVSVHERFPSGKLNSWVDVVVADSIRAARRIAVESLSNDGLINKYAICKSSVSETGQTVSVWGVR